jgi:adenylate cyclase
MYFRIGINLGDVVEEGERIYGDAVNVAARVEILEEGRGRSISGTAYDQLGKKLPLGYEYLGEQSVKNIEKPVRVYRVLTEAEAAGKVIGEVRPKTKQLRWAAIGGVVVLIIVAASLAIWNFYLRPPFEPASVERMAFPLPNRPSIAVLPFKNISGESKQEFLADGITESLIAAISRVSGLFVIASNSVFTYKGKPVKIQTVSEELGVRYVLEGTVQRIGNRLRVNAQLIDAITGRHLWSEKYDREMKDLFSVQDDISKEVLTSLQVKLVEGEQARVWARGTNNLDAYIKFLQAYYYFRSFSKQNMILVRQICEEAIALDPNYEQPHSLIGASHLLDLWFSWGESPSDSMKKSIKYTEKGLSLNPESDFAYGVLCHLYLMQRRYDESVKAGEKGIALNPNGDFNMVLLGITFNFVRRYEEAITLFKEAQRRHPHCPAWYIHNMGISYRNLRRWDEAIMECQRALDKNPDHFPALVVMAQVYGMAGQLDEGRAVAEKMLKMNPRFSVKATESWPYKYKSDAEAVRNSLRKVGIPETPPLPLPDKPSIAVLPFVNMSGDPEQEYFSDGITEEIITALSKTPKLFVIARTSSFKYKGKEVDVRTVGRELGVRYVLEGSVRKAGDKVRITAQLIDAQTNQHLWAERYDRGLKDIFALQDEITIKILTAMQVKLTQGEQARIFAKGTNNLKAYLRLLQGLEYLGHWNKQSNILARQMFEESIALDPEYAVAYEKLAGTYAMDYWYGSKSLQGSIERAKELALKALALDDSLPGPHSLLGLIQYNTAEGKRAIELAPNSADSYVYYGTILSSMFRFEEAIQYYKKGMRLNPIPPGLYFRQLGVAYLNTNQLEKAIAAFEKAVNLSPDDIFAHMGLIWVYDRLDREEDARKEAAEILRIDPEFSIELNMKAFSSLRIEPLLKAGLK